jgi:hypothetical protein
MPLAFIVMTIFTVAAERFGVQATVMFGSLMIGVGLVLAQRGGALSMLVGYGVFIGLLGNAGPRRRPGFVPLGRYRAASIHREICHDVPYLSQAVVTQVCQRGRRTILVVQETG